MHEIRPPAHRGARVRFGIFEFDETTPPPPVVTLRAADDPIVPAESPSAATSARPRPGAPPIVGRPGTPPRPGTRTDNIDPWQK